MSGNQLRRAAFSPAKMFVNGVSTVTNLIPTCQPHMSLRSGYQGCVMDRAYPDTLPPEFPDRSLICGLACRIRDGQMQPGVIVMPCPTAS